MNELPIELIVKENVKSLRKKLGWSQELLAEKTGVSAPVSYTKLRAN
ncbi:MAG: helix-turn-helix transcriptional regulator [Treponemataceae bacterium]|nr:helix-turn-helix transcriptional regulator [Treponemataceae bacterium]